MIGKIIVFSVIASAVNAQVLNIGKCPNVTVVQEFDVVGYLGQWYQVARYPNAFEFGNCSSALYGPVNEDGTVQVLNKEIIDGEESSVRGTAELANANSTEAKLIVKFGIEGINQTIADYWVLATDYENYSIVFNCIEAVGNLFNLQTAWILARQKPLPEELLDVIMTILDDNKVDITKFQIHDLPECTILP